MDTEAEYLKVKSSSMMELGAFQAEETFNLTKACEKVEG